jgi:hypothetical protein
MSLIRLLRANEEAVRRQPYRARGTSLFDGDDDRLSFCARSLDAAPCPLLGLKANWVAIWTMSPNDPGCVKTLCRCYDSPVILGG